MDLEEHIEEYIKELKAELEAMKEYLKEKNLLEDYQIYRALLK